jgi:hypothetical protein
MFFFPVLSNNSDIYFFFKNSICRLPDASKVTKARVEKHGQHKLGQGGYGKLKARIVRFK